MDELDRLNYIEQRLRNMDPTLPAMSEKAKRKIAAAVAATDSRMSDSQCLTLARMLATSPVYHSLPPIDG